MLGAVLTSAAQAQSPKLMIDRELGPCRLALVGEPGSAYVLEGATDLKGSNAWEALLRASPASGSLTWFDAASMQPSHRFYRAVRMDSSWTAPRASNFRLLDHTGRSHELDYHHSDSNVHAVVLVFNALGCDKVHEMIPALHALRDQFGPQVLFWLIDSNSADDRSRIAAEAVAQGIDLPILHDSSQLVVREYGATAAPEVFAMNKSDSGWVIFYRGAIDDRVGSATNSTTQYYLADALGASLANQPVTISRAKADGCALDLNPPQTLSYSADIAPLLQQNCVRCHSPGNIAPWAMTNYDIVQAYAPLIKEAVLTGEMPPWHADPFYQTFANDVSLKPEQAAALVQWINEGAPRGGGPDPLATTQPAATNYPFAWPLELGPPDLVLSIPPQNIEATGVLDYRYLKVTTTFPTNAWLRAAVILPGNTRVVHHCLVYYGSDSLFAGLAGFFAGYVPGYDPVAFPEGTGKLLPKSTELTFQMHYVTTGQPETDQTRIGLYVLPAPPSYELQTRSAPNIGFTIPPRASDLEATASYTFNKKALLYEMSPHMHLRGSRFRYEALYPDGTREVLLSVPHYEFHWQTLYRLAQPKLLPAGTRLLCTGAWDNSPQNTENPNPDAVVRFGEQTFDEMFIGYFNFAEVP